MHKRDTRDIIGGLGLAAIGLFAVIYGQRYEFGDLNRMGAGYFPVALGALLAVLGMLIALPAFFRRGEPMRGEGRGGFRQRARIAARRFGC